MNRLSTISFRNITMNRITCRYCVRAYPFQFVRESTKYLAAEPIKLDRILPNSQLLITPVLIFQQPITPVLHHSDFFTFPHSRATPSVRAHQIDSPLRNALSTRTCNSFVVANCSTS